MSVLDNIKNKLNKMFNLNNFDSEFLQYHHKGSCKEPCVDCPSKDKRIFENNKDKPKVGWDNHPFCDCYYSEIEQKPTGAISDKGIYDPDVYLKAWGKLPDYYITKEEARSKGW